MVVASVRGDGFVVLFLNLLYSRWFKHLPILDVLVLAAFFVIRVGSGVVLVKVISFFTVAVRFHHFPGAVPGCRQAPGRVELTVRGSELTPQGAEWIYTTFVGSVDHDLIHSDDRYIQPVHILCCEFAG